MGFFSAICNFFSGKSSSDTATTAWSSYGLTGVERYIRNQPAAAALTGVERYIRAQADTASLTGVERYIRAQG